MVHPSTFQCEPTINLTFGPLWFPNHPILKQGPKESRLDRICRKEDDGRHYVASSVLRRSIQQLRSVELRLHGKVIDASTCEPVPNAIVDVWQTDAMGSYSTTADGDCRGAVVADSDGRYDFLTHLPGSYGITGGVGYHTLGIELPPYSLRHIHVAVLAKGYDVLSTQLTFPNDVTTDFREALAGTPLTHSSVVLALSELKDGSHEASFDFVVVPSSSSSSAPTTQSQNLFFNTSALRDIMCRPEEGFALDVPLPLCHERLLGPLPPHLFFNAVIPGVIFSILLVLIGCPLLVLRWIVVRRKKKEKMV